MGSKKMILKKKDKVEKPKVVETKNDIEIQDEEENDIILKKEVTIGTSRNGEVIKDDISYKSAAGLFNNSIKNANGKRFRTPQVLANSIQKYFEMTDKAGIPPTKVDMCTFLGVSRQTLDNYKKDADPGYKFILDMAHQIIEGDVVSKGLTKDYSNSMAQFMLKNQHGYKDQKELNHEHSGDIGINVLSNDVLDQVSKEFIDAEYEEI